MDLKELLIAKSKGIITRENYWTSVKESLSVCDDLVPLLQGSSAEIIIDSKCVKLKYPLSTGKNIEMLVDSEDTRSIGVSVIAEGRYEAMFERSLLAIGQESLLFLDIGANAGFYSLALAKSFPRSRILAFEPNPKIAGILSKNIELNALGEQISIEGRALSDQSGHANFFVPAFTGSGGGSLKNLHPEEGSPETFVVELVQLDSFNLSGIDLMKIDVEGNELSVLRGALDSIQDSKPTIFIELLRKWMGPFGSHPQEVVNLLVQFGYQTYEILETALREISVIDEDTKSTNFIFVHSSRKAHFEALANC